MATSMEDLMVRLRADASVYIQAFEAAQRITEQAARQIEKSGAQIEGVAAKLGNLGKSLQDTGKSLVATGRDISMSLAPVAGAVGFSVKAFADFDLAMVESTSIMKVTQDEIEQMKHLAIELGTEGKFGPTTLAHSYKALASAGFNAQEAMRLLPVTINFAHAGAFDLFRATDLASAGMNALGMRTENLDQNFANMTRITDVLTRATTLAQGSTEDFSRALSRDAGGVIRQYGLNLEESVAVLGVYHDNAMKAELAGNTFGRMMRLLTAAAVKHAKVHEQLGFAVFDAGGQMRPLADIIENLEQVLGRLTPEAKAATLRMMGFAVLSQKSLLPLIGNSEKIRRFTTELKAAGGMAEHVATFQMTALANQLNLTKNILTAAAIEAGKMLRPAIESISDAVRHAVHVWEGWSEQVRRAVVFTSAIAAVAGPLLIILGAVILIGGVAVSGLAAMTGALLGVARTILFVLNPLTLLRAALASIVGLLKFFFLFVIIPPWMYIAAGAVLIVRAWDDIVATAKTAWENIANFIRDTFTILTLIVVNFGEIVESAWSGIKELWVDIEAAVQPFMNMIATLASDVFAWAREFVVRNEEVIGSILGLVAAGLTLLAVYKMVRYMLVTIAGIIGLQKILATAAAVAWKLWAGAILLVKGMLLAVKASLAIFTFIMGLATGASSGMSLGLLFASGAMMMVKTATVLWNAVLAITPLLVAAVTASVLTLVLAVTTLTAAFAFITTVGLGLFQALKMVAGALMVLPTATGPLKAVTDVFAEWRDILADVVRAARVDMDLAWEILKAGAALAVEQIRNLWPPLWQFMKEGFFAVGTAFLEFMQSVIRQAIAEFKLGFVKLSAGMADIFVAVGLYKGFDDSTVKTEVRLAHEEYVKAEESVRAIQLRALRENVQRAAEGFRVPVETAEIKAARERLEELRKKIPEAETKAREAVEKAPKLPEDIKKQLPKNIQEMFEDIENLAGDSGLDGGKEWSKQFRKGMDLDAVGRFSAEGFARIAAQTEMLRVPNAAANAGLRLPGRGAGRLPQLPVPPVIPARGLQAPNLPNLPQVMVDQGAVIERLQEIRDGIFEVRAAVEMLPREGRGPRGGNPQNEVVVQRLTEIRDELRTIRQRAAGAPLPAAGLGGG